MAVSQQESVPKCILRQSIQSESNHRQLARIELRHRLYRSAGRTHRSSWIAGAALCRRMRSSSFHIENNTGHSQGFPFRYRCWTRIGIIVVQPVQPPFSSEESPPVPQEQFAQYEAGEENDYAHDQVPNHAGENRFQFRTQSQ